VRNNGILGFILLVALAIPDRAIAQMAPQRFISTVDVQVLNAESVVVGKVSNIMRLEPDRPNGAIDVSLAVEQTLKGNAAQAAQRHVDRGNLNLTKSIADMLKRQTRVLVIGNSWIPLEGKVPPAPTAGGIVLREPNKIVEYIREVLRKHPGTTRVETFSRPIPKEVENTLEPFSSYGFQRGFIVPVDELLETWAREAVRRDTAPIAPSASYQTTQRRLTAMQALQHFKSDANITLLKELLNDAEFDLRSPESNNGIEGRTYRVRREAYDTLKKWGVDVAEPVFTEEIPRFETVERISWQGMPKNSEIQNLSRAGNLRTLSFFADVSDSQLDVIGRVTTLRQLFLKGPITDSGLRALQRLSNLEDLDLSLTRISDAGVIELVPRLPNLKRLVLLGTRVSDDALATLMSARSLKTLDLTLTRTTNDGVRRAKARRPDMSIDARSKVSAPGPGLRLASHAFEGDVENIQKDLDEFRIGPNSTDPSGTPAIFYAVAQKREETVLYLLDRNTRVDVFDAGRSTPLQWAARYGYTGITKLLLTRGASATYADRDGNTALHYAAKNDSSDTIRILLSAGANPSTRNNEGKTPLDVAMAYGQPSTAALLRKGSQP
jgi:hypothetical protein